MPTLAQVIKARHSIKELKRLFAEPPKAEKKAEAPKPKKKSTKGF